MCVMNVFFLCLQLLYSLLLLFQIIYKRMLQHLARTGVKLLPGPVPLPISGQQVRFKKFGKWIVPHRKPRWIPMARSKMFVDPPESTVPISEQEHIKELETEYLMR